MSASDDRIGKIAKEYDRGRTINLLGHFDVRLKYWCFFRNWPQVLADRWCNGVLKNRFGIASKVSPIDLDPSSFEVDLMVWLSFRAQNSELNAPLTVESLMKKGDIFLIFYTSIVHILVYSLWPLAPTKVDLPFFLFLLNVRLVEWRRQCLSWILQLYKKAIRLVIRNGCHRTRTQHYMQQPL